MKPSDFQKTIQCQFDCKLKRVVKGMGYPSSYRDRTREKAMQNTPPKSKGQATKQS